MVMLRCGDYFRGTIGTPIGQPDRWMTEMTPEYLARIENDARRMRAEVLVGMVRGFVRRIARAPIVTARAHHAA
jgi:hypothetical protein